MFLQNFLRGRLSATSVDSCWMPQRQIEQRSPSAERKNSESSGCKATSRASASSRSPSASWMRLGFLTTRHVAVLVLRLTCWRLPSHDSKERWVWDSSQCWTGFQKMPPSLKVCSMRATMSMTASAMICFIVTISQSLTEPELRFVLAHRRFHSSSTTPGALSTSTSPVSRMPQIGSCTFDSPGCTCSKMKSFQRKSALSIWDKPETQSSFVQHRGWLSCSAWCKTAFEIHQRSKYWHLQGKEKAVSKSQREEWGKAHSWKDCCIWTSSSKKGTTSPVARTYSSGEAASSSTSARAWLDAPQSASGDREYTGKWVKWHGRWYQKVIRHGRTEWEEWKPARCSRRCFCTIAAFLLVSLTAFWVVAVMAVYKAHATNPASLRWLTWGGCNCTSPQKAHVV